MNVINCDKNGKIIEDLSKVTIPYDLSADIWEILNPGRKAKRKEQTGKNMKGG